MGKPRLTFNQLQYLARPEYQEAQRRRARARYERLKREGGPEFRLLEIRKGLYQAREIIAQHLDAVEYQEKKLDALIRERDGILRGRRLASTDSGDSPDRLIRTVVS